MSRIMILLIFTLLYLSMFVFMTIIGLGNNTNGYIVLTVANLLAAYIQYMGCFKLNPDNEDHIRTIKQSIISIIVYLFPILTVIVDVICGYYFIGGAIILMNIMANFYEKKVIYQYTLSVFVILSYSLIGILEGMKLL